MKIYYNPKLKELARQLRNNSTKAEIRLWQYLKGKQLRGYDFHRQKPIDNFIADFYCFKLRLIIETDGFTHQFEDVYQKDLYKDKKLKEIGFEVLRFDDDEVMKNIDNVLRTIENYIDQFEAKHTPNPSF